MLPLDREFETIPEAIPNLRDELLQPPLTAANPSPWAAALPLQRTPVPLQRSLPAGMSPPPLGRARQERAASEEGGVRREGSRQPEILAGQHAVHALRQRLGVGGGPGHRGAQDHLPARGRGELRLHPLPALLLRARAPQLLLQRRHGGDLRQEHSDSDRAGCCLTLPFRKLLKRHTGRSEMGNTSRGFMCTQSKALMGC